MRFRYRGARSNPQKKRNFPGRQKPICFYKILGFADLYLLIKDKIPPLSTQSHDEPMDACTDAGEPANAKKWPEIGRRTTNVKGIEEMVDTKESTPQWQNGGKIDTSPIDTPRSYIEYYAACSNNLAKGLAYLQKRGLSDEIADQYGIGYDAAEKRIIVPITESFYIARATAEQEPRYKNPAGQAIQIFNLDAIYKSDVVFMVEGVFDALSVLECGKQAIALNSTSNTKLLLQTLKDNDPYAILIISMDNDGAGKAAAQKLADGLKALKISYGVADISGKYKDPNDFLRADRAGFLAELDRAERNVLYPDSAASYLVDGFDADLRRFKEGGKPTGFPQWDKLSTGLHAGLYMIAATPGAGKTTLCYQIAEHLATAGEDVIFFSLEQTRFDLITKSISRRIKIADMKTKLTSTDVRDGSSRASKAVRAARNSFTGDIGNRLSIVEGNFSLSAKDISDYVESYIRRTKSRPIVIVDYLQALHPMDESVKKGIREAIDDTTDCLCGLKLRYGLTMIVVSSVSRANYYAPLDMDALKESGRLEYSADAVWLLELACLRDSDFESCKDLAKKKDMVDCAKKATPRSLVLKCVKSRFCSTGIKTNLDYYSGNDLFVEDADGDFKPILKSTDNPFAGMGVARD